MGRRNRRGTSDAANQDDFESTPIAPARRIKTSALGDELTPQPGAPLPLPLPALYPPPMRHLVPVLALALLFLPHPALPCSVVPTYVPPTNVELVVLAPVIVVALAEDEIHADTYEGQVEFKVTRVLRGEAPAEKLLLRGYTRDYFGPSAKADFSQARPGAYRGGCVASDYQIGRYYLLFLINGHQLLSLPFTRVNEEVEPSGDPWVAAVTEYVRIAVLSTPSAKAEGLRALIEAGARPGASDTARAIAADVTSHLGAATPYKLFGELKPMAEASDAKARVRALMAIGTGADPAAKAFMRALVEELSQGAPPVPWRAALTAVAAYYEKVDDPPAVSKLCALYTSIGSEHKRARWPLMWLLIHRATAAEQSCLERALEGADDEEAGRLVEWFVGHPSPPARENLRKRQGADAEKLYAITIGLAGMGDPAVVAWAKAKLTGAQRGAVASGGPPTTPDADRWVAAYAIAASPTREADVLAQEIMARGGEDLIYLIQGYKDARHKHVEARLKQLERQKTLGAEARRWLRRTIDERATDGSGIR